MLDIIKKSSMKSVPKRRVSASSTKSHALLSHPELAEAFSFSVPDDKYGEEIKCDVIPIEGSNINEGDVLRHCKGILATFKVPKKVFMADDLPKTASGKIKRRDVAEHFLSQISAANVPKFGA